MRLSKFLKPGTDTQKASLRHQYEYEIELYVAPSHVLLFDSFTELIPNVNTTLESCRC